MEGKMTLRHIGVPFLKDFLIFIHPRLKGLLPAIYV
jgi:hypothetical protein